MVHISVKLFLFQDMQIKVSKHVDASGKIYLPYLHEWSYPNSDLVGLIQVSMWSADVSIMLIVGRE
jgi:hypothetical protein